MNLNMILRQFNARRKKLDDGMEVRRVQQNIIDVFQGDGFNTHSRYRQVGGNWVHVSGIRLTVPDLRRATA